jgi:hypothetical protein
LSGWVNAWTSNNKYLLAIQVPDESSRSSIELVFDGNTGISLPYEVEKCKDLAIPSTTADQDHSHWATRAIRHKQTALNDYELVDFLTKLNNYTTFGFVKIKTEQPGTQSARRYFMTIVRKSQITLDLIR